VLVPKALCFRRPSQLSCTDDGARYSALRSRRGEDAAGDVLGFAIALRQGKSIVLEELFWDLVAVATFLGPCCVPVANAGNGREEEDVRTILRRKREVDTATSAGNVRGFIGFET